MGLSPSNAIQRPDLGMAMEELDIASQRKGFIATRAFPVVDVALATANFSRVSIKDLLDNRDTTRAPGAGYNRQFANFEQDNYACKEHGVEEPIDDREKQMYAYTIDSEKIALARGQFSILNDLEKRVAAQVFNTGTWTNYTGNSVGWLTQAVTAGAWSVPASCDPTADITAAWLQVWEACGMEPNGIIFNKAKWKQIKNAASIIDRIKYSGQDDPKNVTPNMLAELWDLDADKIMIAGAQYNSANEGQNSTLARIWSDSYAFVGHFATTNDVREPCVGRVFNWTGDGSSPNGTVEMYRDETVRSDVLRIRQDTAEKQLHNVAGCLITGI